MSQSKNDLNADAIRLPRAAPTTVTVSSIRPDDVFLPPTQSVEIPIEPQRV